jgi:hypothetical protein
MPEKQNSSIAQIRNLLVVIGAGMMCGILLTYMMLANFGPSGQYIVSNILLEPSLVEKITYQENNSRYSFDRIEFMFFNDKANRWESQKLNQATYGEIYQIIKGDKSIDKVASDVQTLFYTSKPGSLTLVVHTENRDNTKVFQELQFEEHGDYYRIMLREDEPSQNWVYFNHPKVLEKIKKIVKQ